MVIHGATATKHKSTPKNKVRRVINAWLLAISLDHKTLEILELGTWATITRLYRDLMPSKMTLSGNLNMIGLQRWDSPAVTAQARMLLGGPERDAAAHAIINDFRRQVFERYLAAFGQMQEAEIETYGKDSYFVAVAEGRWVPARKRKQNGGGIWPWNSKGERLNDFDINPLETVEVPKATGCKMRDFGGRKATKLAYRARSCGP
ncbi:hypothetical protein TWF173_009154 [Orbilia oligospora]|nr:hypothetical protein TWF173_009154 [Orbilia oligospora]